MTKFEQMLIDKGYIKYILNRKTMKYEIAKGHIISTMVNIDHRYFHSTDKNVIDKIQAGKSVMDKDFTYDDRKGEIIFGLNEYGFPSTLKYPRPRIQVKRFVDGREVIQNETYDSSMNVVLDKIPHDEILKAMYDRDIVIKIDLTDI